MYISVYFNMLVLSDTCIVSRIKYGCSILRLVSKTLYLTSEMHYILPFSLKGAFGSTRSVGGLLCLNLSTLNDTASMMLLKDVKEESVLNPD